MHTIVEMPEFTRRAKKLDIAETELKEIIDVIAANPQAGNEIPGTGGARKIRFPAKSKGRGKSGGYRVVTFFSGTDLPVFLITVYEKGEKEDLTQDQKNEMKTVFKMIVETYKNWRKK